MAPWLLLGIGHKSLEPLSDPMLVQWVLCSSWCTTMPDFMWREYEGSFWKMKEYRWLPPSLPALNPVKCLWYATWLHLRLSRSSVIPWCRSGRRSLRTPFVISLEAQHCQACIQAHGDHTNYRVLFWVAAMKFQNFQFHQTMWHPLIPNTLPSPYQQEISSMIFPHWDLMCFFQSIPLIFLSSVHVWTECNFPQL